MDSGLARALGGAVLVLGLALAAPQAPAQWADLPPASPPPVDTPPQGSAPINSPEPQAAPPPAPSDTTPATNDANDATNAPPVAPPPPPPPIAKPPPPPGPPLPLRTPTAVMQVLDKVTAETLQFEAPIGRPIRYKTLVMTVRVCETRGASDPQPRPSAYIEMETRVPAVAGHEAPPAKPVFEGWMFANAPALHALEHPIYDAWLVGCNAGTSVSR